MTTEFQKGFISGLASLGIVFNNPEGGGSSDYNQLSNIPLSLAEDGTVVISENYQEFFNTLKNSDVNYNNLIDAPLKKEEETISINENYQSFFQNAIKNSIIEMPLASELSPGAVQIGEGLVIEKGILSSLGSSFTDSSAAPLTSFDYSSDSQITVNDITYSIVKNDSGAITEITDNKNGQLIPTFNENLSDYSLYNATLLATVFAKELYHPLPLFMPNLDGIYGYFDITKNTITALAWENSIEGYENISLSDGVVEDDALKIGNPYSGTFTLLNNETFTLYIVSKVSSFSGDYICTAMIENIKPNNNFKKGEISIQPYRVNNIDIGTYDTQYRTNAISPTNLHLLAIKVENQSIKIWLNGELVSSNLTVSTLGTTLCLGGYLRDGVYSSPSGGFSYIKFLAIAETAQSDNLIEENCAYLIKKFKISTS